MPVYVYGCRKCDAEFEMTQKMLDEPIKECIECGGEAYRKIIGVPSIVFNGSGFHANDYSSYGRREVGKD